MITEWKIEAESRGFITSQEFYTYRVGLKHILMARNIEFESSMTTDELESIVNKTNSETL